MDTEPVYTQGEYSNIKQAIPAYNKQRKPTYYTSNFVTANIPDLPPEAEIIKPDPNPKVLYTTHMEPEPEKPPTWASQTRKLGRSMFGITKSTRKPRTDLDNTRQEFDIDLQRIGNICLQSGLNIENYGISDVEATMLYEILNNMNFTEKQKEEKLKKYCIAKKIIMDKKPDMEQKFPITYIIWIWSFIKDTISRYTLEILLNHTDNTIKISENDARLRSIYNNIIHNGLPSAIELSELADHYASLGQNTTRITKRESLGGRKTKKTRKMKKLNKKTKRAKRFKK